MLAVLHILVYLISTVILHEYAHYKAGVLLGIKPVEVGLGFGPTLYRKELKNYVFKLKLLPLGGYVSYGKSMFDEEVFYGAPAWKRFLIALAGPVSNILYAFVLFLFVNMYYVGGAVDIAGVYTSFVDAGRDTILTGSQIAQSTATYMGGQAAEVVRNIQGPIGAYKTFMEYAKTPEYMLLLFAMLNIALAMFNLLPFPALDGYTALTSFIEMLTKKRFSTNVEKWVNIVGFSVLMGLSVVVLFWDLIQMLLRMYEYL